MTPWDDPSTVAGFAAAPPNAALIEFSRREMARASGARALDIGCGAGRNAVPLAALGWDVLGTDLSPSMLYAARERKAREAAHARLTLAVAAMDRLPVADCSCDLLVAHGVWNLAQSGAEFRAAAQEAGRAAKREAALFVFLFSRSTLPPAAAPEPGESFVFTHFNNQRQCFLSHTQLVEELGRVGFAADPDVALREVNPRRAGMLVSAGSAVIWEGVFRRTRHRDVVL